MSTKPQNKRRGRPPKRSQDKKEGYLDVRLEPSEKLAFKHAAELAGISLSTWVRERLRKIERHELEEAGQAVPFIKPRF